MSKSPLLIPKFLYSNRQTVYPRYCGTVYYESSKRKLFVKVVCYTNNSNDLVDYVIYPKKHRGVMINTRQDNGWLNTGIKLLGHNLSGWHWFGWRKRVPKIISKQIEDYRSERNK
jgi:hypothetical protein